MFWFGLAAEASGVFDAVPPAIMATARMADRHAQVTIPRVRSRSNRVDAFAFGRRRGVFARADIGLFIGLLVGLLMGLIVRILTDAREHSI
ncbi:MAG: hypothetical protein ABUL48_00110 [Pseudorhodoplanes sp.]